MRPGLMLWLVLLLLIGCMVPGERSAWGPVYPVAEAAQSRAPALWADTERALLAWVGADAAAIHQDVRLLIDGTLGPAQALPLPTRRPYAQQIFPARGGRTHLLWLDADESRVNRLYVAQMGAELTLERGAVPVSVGLALRYTAASRGDGALWTVWSGAPPAEPALSARLIEASGLPGPILPLAYGADWPALIRANDGTQYLFWLDSASRRVTAALLGADGLTAVRPQDIGVMLVRGDRLTDFQAALDTTHIYLFWNVDRVGGAAETWWTARPLAGGDWSGPALLALDTTRDAPFVTGFNTGTASVSGPGVDPVRRVAPLAGQYDVLPVAGQIGESLGVIYFHGGMIVGYQALLDGRLLRPPALAVDRDRHLYLAWSEPGEIGPAALKLTTTRPAG